MPWSGAGDFSRTHNFSADASASIGILASRMDAEFGNYETGLENCVTRDGQNQPTAALPMGGFNHTGAGIATSANQYLRADQFLRQTPIYAAFGGTAENMSASTVLALTSLTAGVQVLLSCGSVNTTTSVTLGLAGASTATVVRADGRGPARGQTLGLHRYVHDGTNWILTDPSPPLGRILITTASVQAASVTNGLQGYTVASTDGFSVSTSVVIVPGGVRRIRLNWGAVVLTGTSATGAYSFEIYRNAATPVASFGGNIDPTHVVWHHNQANTHATIIADYVSVVEGDKIAFAVRNTSAAQPAICRAGYIYVEATD